LLGEASHVAHALVALLKRANIDASDCEALVKEIVRQENIALQLSYGRVEGRRRFKGHSPQPLLDGRYKNFLYLDEGGKSFPEPATQPQFFSLAAVSITRQENHQYVKRANAVKSQFLGRVDITFHEPFMREHDGPYSFNGDKGKQAAFDQAIDRLVTDTSFVAFGVGVRKLGFERDFMQTHIDPYLPTDAYAVAITLLMERYIDYLAMLAQPKSMGHIIFESQGPREDALHQMEYVRLFLEGSQWIEDGAFRNWLEPGVRFVPKQGSSPLELADMLAREIFEWVRGECRVTPKRWDLFSNKFYCRGDGRMGKFGLKIFPDADVRDLIEEHRKRCGAVADELKAPNLREKRRR